MHFIFIWKPFFCLEANDFYVNKYKDKQSVNKLKWRGGLETECDNQSNSNKILYQKCL